MKRVLFLLPFFLLLLCPALAEEITDTQGEFLAAENQHYRLFLTYEKGETLQFSVESTESGFRWRSSPEGWKQSSDRKKRMQTGSQLIVTSREKSSKAPYTANSQVSSVGEGGTRVTLTEGGFRVDYDFPREKDRFTVPVVYTLEDDGLRVDLMMTEIREYGEVFVQSVALLPNFFAGETDAPGYLLIPDGCGALIDFQANKKGMKGYKQSIYGRDPSLTSLQRVGQSMTATLPILGIHAENAGGVLMIADKNAALAAACAYPAGTDTVYSSAYFEFTYRAVDKLKLADKSWYATDVEMVNAAPNSRQDATVLYRFLEGDASGYMEMAAAYRDYLRERGMRGRAEKEPILQMDLYGGIKKDRSVLGVIVTDLLPMTTFSQAGEILRALRAAGADRVSATFYGWNRGGLQDCVQATASPEARLGGKAAFSQLEQDAKDLGYSLLWDTDLVRFFKTDLTHHALLGAAQTITGEAAAQYEFQVSTYQKNETVDPYYLLAPDQIARVAGSMMHSIGTDAFSFSSLGETAYSDFRYNANVDREEMTALVGQVLADAAGRAGRLAVSQGNAYTLPWADQINQLPLFDSDYLCAFTDVPFVSLVLHGWKDLFSPPVNLSEDQDTFLLRLLETGTNPAFAVTWQPSAQLRDTRYEYLLSTQWEQQRGQILSVWQTWRESMAGLGDQMITGHRIEGDLRCTAYENGVRVYVNYGWDDGTLDGHTVPARGYLVVREGGEK